MVGGGDADQPSATEGVARPGFAVIAGVLTVASLVPQSGASAATLKTLYRFGLQSGGGTAFELTPSL
jgi:hypothetical protein